MCCVSGGDSNPLKAMDAAFTGDKKFEAVSASFAAATEQADKLQLGGGLSVVTSFDNCLCVHTFTSPLLLTLIATTDANTAQVSPYCLLPAIALRHLPLTVCCLLFVWLFVLCGCEQLMTLATELRAKLGPLRDAISKADS